MKRDHVTTISASEFKARCLQLMDEVAAGETEVVITKRGRAVARLVAEPAAESRPLFGRMRGTIEIRGDIVNFSSEELWDALRE